MKLIDEDEFKTLLSLINIEETVSGGSVANSIVGLSQLGNNVGFIGKINEDSLGQKYEDGLKKEKVNYLYNKKKEPIPTGSCLILITPDSERTMCTYLGTAGKINDQDIDESIIKNSEITFLEGYLWDEGEPKKAFDKDKRVLNSSLSISFIVLFVNEFLTKKSSSTLHRTSTIAFPIPKIFILCFFSYYRFFSIRITSVTNFTS